MTRRSPAPPPTAEDRRFDEAVGFAVRLHENPWDAAALEDLRLWRARGPLHEAAWAEIAEIYGLSGEALTARRLKRRGLTRRRLLWGGAAGAGVAAAGWALAPRLIASAQAADHRTGTARLAPLNPPGWRMILGPKSAMAFTGADQTGFRLISGMAWCEIPQSRAATAFSCRIGAAEIQTQGGAFALSLEAERLSAAAEAGMAEIRFPDAAPQQLAAGERVVLGRRGEILDGGASPPGAASAWLKGRLIVDAEPLAALVERIARWLPERVILTDSALGARLISGVFDLSAPREALRTALAPHGGRLQRLTPLVTLILAA